MSRARLLTEIWQNIQMNQVFRTDVQSFTKIGWHLCRDILGSGTFGGARANFLLDASPLLQFLAEQIDFDQIQHNLKTGLIYSLAVSATQ
ncbi:MAG: hypothetical protein NTX25_18870 [Proteobacteria bacterium]|nr:hypothetical protein [Pseudomonadota bacterium]